MQDALNLYQRLNSKLYELLSSLSVEQWNKKVLGGNLTVKDTVNQLLNESRRNLSQVFEQFDSNNFEVKSNKNLSINEILSDLQNIQQQSSSYFNDFSILSPLIGLKGSNAIALDLNEIYAKNWLYQQKLRQVLGIDLLLESDFYYPFLDYCLLFLPQHFENIWTEENTIISISIVSETNKSWQIIRRENFWELTESQARSTTQVYIDQNIAWIIFSGGIDIYEASQYWQVIGNQELGRHVLTLRPLDKIPPNSIISA